MSGPLVDGRGLLNAALAGQQAGALVRLVGGPYGGLTARLAWSHAQYGRLMLAHRTSPMRMVSTPAGFDIADYDVEQHRYAIVWTDVAGWVGHHEGVRP